MRTLSYSIVTLALLSACGAGGDNRSASDSDIQPAAVLQTQAAPSAIETTTASAVAAKAVDLTDAIAILKMIVGLDVNPGGAALTAYQSYAADVDGNGKVELSDAISVLKRIVGLETATANWMFFNGTPAVNDKLNPGLPPSVSATISSSNNVSMTVVLRGDVVSSNAFTYSWALSAKPTGSSATMTSTTAANPSFKADLAGTYVATMTITDGSKNVATSSVTLTACNASSNTSNPFVGCTPTTGGQGGGGVCSSNEFQLPTITQNRETPFVNVNAALAAILQLDTTFGSLLSNNGYLEKATLIIGNDQAYPFVSADVSKNTTVSKRFQLQIDDASGRLSNQYIWKLHLDSSGNPLGLATSDSLYKSRLCSTSNSSSVLPSSSNTNGTFFSGLSGSYFEQFRSGTYAHYCDISSSSSVKTVSWSVADGDPSPYVCLTFPASWGPKTQICFVSNSCGSISGKPWIRTYSSDVMPANDYKDTTVNKPYQVFSTEINPNDFWYGKVWRPSDGYIYKAYTSTYFSSQLACREQTQIDWRSIYTASNIAWTCSNVVRR